MELSSYRMIIKIIYQVDDFEKAGERKSIPVEFCRENGIRIPSEKKRTLYRYDLSSWLKRYELSVEVSMR